MYKKVGNVNLFNNRHNFSYRDLVSSVKSRVLRLNFKTIERHKLLSMSNDKKTRCGCIPVFQFKATGHFDVEFLE